MSSDLEQAQVLRELALAEKYRAEANDFDAARELKEQETVKARAEAQYAVYNAEAMRVNTEAALRQEQIILAGNHHHHYFEFNQSVTDEAVDQCLSQMAVWHRMDPTCPMHIAICSDGGSVIAGMQLFDQLSAYSRRPWDKRNFPRGEHDTTMTVRGWAASMGGILVQAADHRVIGPEAYLMIHEVSSFAGGKLGDIKDEVDFLDKLTERVTDIFIRRAKPGMTRAKFKKLWDRKDAYLTSEEALEFGFVDAIG